MLACSGSDWRRVIGQLLSVRQWYPLMWCCPRQGHSYDVKCWDMLTHCCTVKYARKKRIWKKCSRWVLAEKNRKWKTILFRSLTHMIAVTWPEQNETTLIKSKELRAIFHIRSSLATENPPALRWKLTTKAHKSPRVKNFAWTLLTHIFVLTDMRHSKVNERGRHSECSRSWNNSRNRESISRQLSQLFFNRSKDYLIKTLTNSL